MRNLINSGMLLVLVGILAGCGFHLRGRSGDFKFPYASVYLECNNVIICPGLRSTITHESLTVLSPRRESAEEIIVVAHEQTSRDALDYNRTGQIASFILSYQVTAQIFNPQGGQIGTDIVVKNQVVIQYNNSLILSASQQEDTTWDQIHQNVINTLVRRIVYSHPLLISPYAAESK